MLKFIFNKPYASITSFFLIILLFLFFFSVNKALEARYPYNIYYIFLTIFFLFNLLFCIFSFFYKKKKEYILCNLSLYFFLFTLNLLLTIFYDSNREIEFIKKYKKLYLENGIYLNFRPKALSELNNLEFYPLGSIPGKKMYFCNEDKKKDLFIYNDKYGFNNQSNVKYVNSDIMLIGDSFTQGECVENKYNLANLLRRGYNGKNVLNFGMGGSGPISHFAIIREYAKYFSPKNIIIFTVGNNDRWDLNNEYQNKILFKYVEKKDFSQGLIDKENFIRNFIEKFIHKNYVNLVSKRENFFISLKNHLTFQKLRGFISSRIVIFLSEKQNNYDYELDKKVIQLINEETTKIKSNLYIIYLPDYYELFGNYKKNDLLRKKYFEILDQEKIEYINFYTFFKDLIYKKNYNKEDFFILGKPNNHYTPKIYKFIADTIKEKKILKF